MHLSNLAFDSECYYACPDSLRTVSGEFGLDNGTVFSDLVKSGVSEADAVWRTPLGKSLKVLGFTDIKMDGIRNGITTFYFGVLVMYESLIYVVI